MRSRRARRGRLVGGLAVLLVLVLVLVGAAMYAVVTVRAVIPGVSDRIYPIHYQAEIAEVAARYDVDPYLIAAVVRAESNYDPRAVSRAGAVGLMQLMPDTAAWIVKLDRWQGPRQPTLTDPEDNLELGACYLAYLLERFGGDEQAALASYNAGQNQVDTWLDASAGKSGLLLTDIPFAETREFVERVDHYRSIYNRVYEGAFAAENRTT